MVHSFFKVRFIWSCRLMFRDTLIRTSTGPKQPSLNERGKRSVRERHLSTSQTPCVKHRDGSTNHRLTEQVSRSLKTTGSSRRQVQPQKVVRVPRQHDQEKRPHRFRQCVQSESTGDTVLKDPFSKDMFSSDRRNGDRIKRSKRTELEDEDVMAPVRTTQSS